MHPDALRLSRQGEAVPFHIEGTTLYFVSVGGEGNPYGEEAVYELEVGVSGERMVTGSAVPGGAPTPYYWERVRQEDLSELPVGRQVVVIGAGNTAIDMAVQIKKLGAESVTMVYRRSVAEMGATVYEQHVAQTNGVLIRTHAKPLRLLTENGQLSAVQFEYTEKDANDQYTGTGETFVLPADQVFKAIGQALNMTPFENGEMPELIGRRIEVDQHQHTSLPDVWAGGDCTPGLDLTVTAVQDGKIAALNINEYLNHG